MKKRDNFYKQNTKQKILIVDDEMINREILRQYLENDYDLLMSEDGQQALDLIKEKKTELSLILLDLMLPSISGKEILKQLKNDPETEKIPVIVMTADNDSEVECLELGASDFISKPYPSNAVVLARIHKTIELHEKNETLQETERDSLTGLYNKEFFFRYAQQHDLYHQDEKMDAILLNVNRFHMINERFGRSYGDDLLRQIAAKLKKIMIDKEGIVCRRDADTFMIYCPHLDNNKEIYNAAASGFDKEVENIVRLRMGVYENVDKSIDLERRFDRAKAAADTIRNNFNRSIAVYVTAMHEKEMYNEQLIESFPKAVEEKQFEVYYQPKFDIQNEIPVLSSAEALVRWKHPELGMISPGVFVPLFEENGLVLDMDNYVWTEVVEQINDWKNRIGITVPVSVNVSRVDMFEINLVERFKELLKKHDVTAKEFLLEITESAYTEDANQIIEIVNDLRSIGFKIEMDDFGTGYSSLNMISSLPIDALKIDMGFVRNAFNNGKDTRILEVIIDIAKYLGVPTIAEGVETKEQVEALKEMGCDIIQGYFFSKPLPAAEFERFLIEKKKQLEAN